ncbi:MAG: hypothetical protein ACRYFU_16935 [Janthinobacterium lividum]
MSIQSPVDAFRTLALCSIVALLGVAGCKSDPAARTSESNNQGVSQTASAPSTPVPVAAPVDPAQAGTIAGIVHFAGTPPARVPIDMSMDPACSFGGDYQSEQYVVSKGGLANVFVYVKAGLPPSAAPPGSAPVHIDQHGCRFIPHVAAVQQGGSVSFTNSDPTMHNIHTLTVASNPSIDVSQGPGAQPQVRQFNAPETMLSIRCNNHPWMNGFLSVAPNAFFAVTNVDGTFTITGLPPGTYTLAAVHEKLGEQDTQVTVAPHSIAKPGFTFSMH